MLALTLLAALASADTGLDLAEPRLEARDGHVFGRITLHATVDEVRQVLGDGAETASHSPDVLRASATPEGVCERVDLEVRGLFAPFRVQTRRCPTAEGFTERLAGSTVFTAWEGTWRIVPVADGTEVVYSLRTRLDLPVPQGLVERRTMRALELNLLALADAVDAGGW